MLLKWLEYVTGSYYVRLFKRHDYEKIWDTLMAYGQFKARAIQNVLLNKS